MTDPPSPTVGDQAVVVVGTDEQVDIDVDVDRWCRLASDALRTEGGPGGELTLTFVDREEIAALNQEYMGHDGATDVLSFPLDDAVHPAVAGAGAGVPMLLGDVVICPAVAGEQAPDHAGTLEDELALLVIHGVLHVLGHDHSAPDETAVMQARELDLLMTHHWGGPPPPTFRQEHRDIMTAAQRMETRSIEG